MDKRAQKLDQALQLAMLRVQDGAALQRVEVEAGRRKLVLQADPNGGALCGEDGRVLLAGLPGYLKAQVAAEPRALIRIVERGTAVNLELFPADVKMSISTLDAPAEFQHHPVAYGTRQQFIKAQEAMELLQALDIASSDGKIRADKRRKFFQVDRFVELVDEMLAEWQRQRPLVILDCGCGKSYLSFVLNYWLTEKRRIPCRIIGIDGNAEVIRTAREIQRRLNYRNMEFIVGSIRSYRPSGPVDMVLSLHACDTATDEALALALHLGCRYIIAVPCCQAALRERIDYRPWQAVARHSIFRNRLADVITDGLRVAALEARGYKVSVVEYVSPLDTPKNIMLRAVHRGGGTRKDYQELQKLVQGVLPLEEYLQAFANR